jgi:lauroyl/myristoyl acyltransferase
MKKITIPLNLTDDEANGLAQLVKRLGRRSLGKDDLNLVTPEEADQAEEAVIALRDALAEAGYAPR